MSGGFHVVAARVKCDQADRACHPSRATFMTGQFLAHRFGDVHNLPDDRRINAIDRTFVLPLLQSCLNTDFDYQPANLQQRFIHLPEKTQ